MTFYEAALAVLEREGKPLHVDQLTEIALKDSLLSHVGKSPQEVMLSRLLAMARRRNDRRVMATAPQTFALVEWGLPEDPAALEPVVEPDKEQLAGPPLRTRERHPSASPSKVRIAGRGASVRAFREEDEERRRRRKLPPLSEVALEVLTAVGTPLAAVDLAAAARERELVSEDLGADALLNALREDNRRRGDSGRRQLFDFLPTGEVALRPAPAEGVELEAAVAFAQAGPLAGRREEVGPGAARVIAAALDQRKQVSRLLRRRLADLDAAGLEKAAVALLEQQGYADLKVMRRSREGALLVARRREGLLELRYAVKLVRGGSEFGRDEVEELRRSVGQQSAHIGILVSAGDPSGKARHEAAAAQPLVFLLCGDALAEACLEKHLGSSVTTVEVHDLDDEFFRRCRERGREERDRRREARAERDGTRPEQAARPEGAQRAEQAAGRTPEQIAEQRARDAAALAAHLTGAAATPVVAQDPEQLRRLEEESQVRLSAHERIEAAEQQARLRRAPSGSAA